MEVHHILQLTGVFVGILGLVMDFLIGFSLLRMLNAITLAAERASVSQIPHRTKPSHQDGPNYNDAWQIIRQLLYVSIYLAIKVGFVSILVLHFVYDMNICLPGLVAWGAVAVGYSFLLELPTQAYVVLRARPEYPAKPKIVAAELVWRFILNWTQSLLIFLLIEMILVTLVAIHILAWVVRRIAPRPWNDLTSKGVRAGYYSALSLCMVFGGILLEALTPASCG